jgi:hypothetical protein
VGLALLLHPQIKHLEGASLDFNKEVRPYLVDSVLING